MNFFTDNADLQYHFHRGVEWQRFVPQWEKGFSLEDGPRSLAEALELYQETLREAGEYLAREVAPRAREVDEQGVGFEAGQVVQPKALLRSVEGLRKLGLIGIDLPRDVGGCNFPFSAGAMFLEMLARA